MTFQIHFMKRYIVIFLFNYNSKIHCCQSRGSSHCRTHVGRKTHVSLIFWHRRANSTKKWIGRHPTFQVWPGNNSENHLRFGIFLFSWTSASHVPSVSVIFREVAKNVAKLKTVHSEQNWFDSKQTLWIVWRQHCTRALSQWIGPKLNLWKSFNLSLPSSKCTFSQHFKE